MFVVTAHAYDGDRFFMFMSHDGVQVAGVFGTSSANVMSTNTAIISCQVDIF